MSTEVKENESEKKDDIVVVETNDITKADETNQVDQIEVVAEEVKDVPMITFETINAVAYGKLKDYFEQIGVKNVWKPGKKKVEMVQEALDQLAVVRQKIAEGQTQEDIDKALKVQEEEAKQAQIKANEEAKKQKEQEQEQTNSDIQSKKLSQEDIKKNIANIDANLKNNIPGQREILLRKRKALADLLEEAEE